MTSPTWLESCYTSNGYRIGVFMFAILRATLAWRCFWRAATRAALPYFIVGRLQESLLPNSSRRSIVIVMSREKLHRRVGRSRIFPTRIRAIGAGLALVGLQRGTISQSKLRSFASIRSTRSSISIFFSQCHDASAYAQL